jgi:hypothetical protein
MSTGLTLLFIVAVIVGLANLGCTIYVVVKLYQAKGIFHALIGFFCCQLYPFIWGWLRAADLNITDIMVFWSATILMGIVLQVIIQMMQTGSAFGQF